MALLRCLLVACTADLREDDEGVIASYCRDGGGRSPCDCDVQSEWQRPAMCNCLRRVAVSGAGRQRVNGVCNVRLLSAVVRLKLRVVASVWLESKHLKLDEAPPWRPGYGPDVKQDGALVGKGWQRL
ncbi:hypothetical protein SESBI_05704 [Sesbania bispinosa]|nr:hypothetical protein SESBI_05704 [Sesbania bispinosa]